jgi:hypothetical protein
MLGNANHITRRIAPWNIDKKSVAGFFRQKAKTD